MLLHILCKDKKINNCHEIKYIRVLGFSKRGIKILKDGKERCNIPIITKFKKEYEYLFKDDIRANKIYSLISNYDIKSEYKTSLKIDR